MLESGYVMSHIGWEENKSSFIRVWKPSRDIGWEENKSSFIRV